MMIFKVWDIKYLRITRNLFNQSALVYGLLYLTLIPMFAAIYTFFIPADFHHSNIVLERGFQADLKQNLEIVESSLKKYFKEVFDIKDKYTFYTSTLNYYDRIFYIRLEFISSNRKCIKALFKIEDEDKCSTPEKCLKSSREKYFRKIRDLEGCPPHSLHYMCSVSNAEWPIEGYSMSCSSETNTDLAALTSRDIYESTDDFNIEIDIWYPVTTAYSLHDNKIKHFPPGKKILNLLHGNTPTAREEVSFVLDNRENVIALLVLHEQLRRGQQHSPSWTVFSRMTYFSAVTITTLGYGDITPITDKARWLITFESILGIILIGLFLNALASKSSERVL